MNVSSYPTKYSASDQPHVTLTLIVFLIIKYNLDQEYVQHPGTGVSTVYDQVYKWHMIRNYLQSIHSVTAYEWSVTQRKAEKPTWTQELGVQWWLELIVFTHDFRAGSCSSPPGKGSAEP